MNKQEALAKARAAKKAKQEMEQGKTLTAQTPASPSEDRYTPEMSDDEVIAFCQRHTQGKSADQITDTNVLEALVRYGEIVGARRQSAEGEGKVAKLRIVKGEIEKLETRFAIASIIQDLAVENLRKTITGQVPDVPFEVIFRVGEHEMVVSFASVYEDHSPGQQQLTTFSKNEVEIAKTVMSGCQRKYHIVNNGSGESFGLPFDFQSIKAGILVGITPDK